MVLIIRGMIASPLAFLKVNLCVIRCKDCAAWEVGGKLNVITYEPSLHYLGFWSLSATIFSFSIESLPFGFEKGETVLSSPSSDFGFLNILSADSSSLDLPAQHTNQSTLGGGGVLGFRGLRAVKYLCRVSFWWNPPSGLQPCWLHILETCWSSEVCI